MPSGALILCLAASSGSSEELEGERASDDPALRSDRDSIEYAIKQLDRADGPTFIRSHLVGVHQAFAEQRDRSSFMPFALTRCDPWIIEAYRRFALRMGPERTGDLVSSEIYAWAEQGEIADPLVGGEVPDARAFSQRSGEYRRATRAWFHGSITEDGFGSVDEADLGRLERRG